MHHAPIADATARVVAGYLSNNTVGLNEVPGLIARVGAEMHRLAEGIVVATERPELKPAVAVKKSITPDHIICLEDGKKFKSLKRHLGSAYGMTPDDYRKKWGLPSDYPMTAPSYSAARSELAKATGLGRK